MGHYRTAPTSTRELEIIERRKMNVGCGNADVSSPRRLSATDVSRLGRYFIQDGAPYCLGIVSGGSGLVTDEDNYALKKNRGGDEDERRRRGKRSLKEG